MKILLILTGLITAQTAFAQSALPEPLSPYVQQVLSRVGRIEQDYLPTLSGSENCDAMKGNAVDIALTDVRAQINATLSFIEQADDLAEITACQRYDLDILERKMQELQDLMIDMTYGCELSTLKAVGLMHSMLGRAYGSVLIGGLSPRYADFQLRGPFLTDQGDPEAQACPFSSDYAPPSLADLAADDEEPLILSVGCDTDRLTFIASQDIPDARRQEAEQAFDFLDGIEGIAADVGGQILAFEQAFRSVFAVVRGDPLPPPVNPNRPAHAAIAGCRELIIEEDMDNDGTLEPNPSRVETWDEDTLPPGMLLKSTADPFSIFRAPFSLMRAFVELRNERGLLRPRVSAIPSDVLSAVMWLEQDGQLRSASGNMGRQSAAVDALSRDGQLRMFAAVGPLREAVRSFGEVASFPAEGEERPYLQTYIRDLALFLRRSCVWGACNDTLDGVLKRVLNEHCYPYGSGCFRKQGYLKNCYENTETEC